MQKFKELKWSQKKWISFLCDSQIIHRYENCVFIFSVKLEVKEIVNGIKMLMETRNQEKKKAKVVWE